MIMKYKGVFVFVLKLRPRLVHVASGVAVFLLLLFCCCYFNGVFGGGKLLFTSLHPLLVMRFPVLLADPFRFAIAILCPFSLLVATEQALRRILDLDHRPICGPTTRMAFQSCSLIWPKCRSTVLCLRKKDEKEQKNHEKLQFKKKIGKFSQIKMSFLVILSEIKSVE